MSSLTKIAELRASAAQLVGSETGTAGNGGLIKLQQLFRQFVFELDVTALADDVDDTLDVYIDTSYDGGTKWVNVGHFTQVLGNAAAQRHLMSISSDVHTEENVTGDAASGVIRTIPIGDRVRYRATVVDPTGADATITYSIGMFAAK